MQGSWPGSGLTLLATAGALHPGLQVWDTWPADDDSRQFVVVVVVEEGGVVVLVLLVLYG